MFCVHIFLIYQTLYILANGIFTTVAYSSSVCFLYINDGGDLFDHFFIF